MKVKVEDFSTTTANEYGEALGFVGLVPGTTVYQLVTDGEYNKYFTIGFSEEWADENNEDGNWFCQIDDEGFGCEAICGGSTPEEALERAVVDAMGTIALRENDNCEDAVNTLTYYAFSVLCGVDAPFETYFKVPSTPAEWEQLDRLMGFARAYVKEYGHLHGITWEEF